MKHTAFYLLLSLVVLVFSFIIGGGTVFAEPKPSAQPPSPQPGPAIDGVVAAGEYPLSFDLAPFKVWVSRTGNVIRFAVSAKTRGWVALGLDSRRMDGAAIFMGEVKNGKAVFSEQTGRGHSHAETPADKRLATKYAVKLEGDTTTVEFECPAAKVLPKDAKELPVILASSPSDSLRAYHATRLSAVLKLE